MEESQRSTSSNLNINGAAKLLSIEGSFYRHFVVALCFVFADYDLAIDIGSHRHRSSKHGVIEGTAGGENRVTNGFGIETLDGFAPIKTIFRIATFLLGIAL